MSYEQYVFLLLSICLIFLMISMAENSTLGSSGDKDSVEMKKPVLLSNLSAPDADLANFMPMDPPEGTPLETCTPGSACAFQVFRRVQGEFFYLKPRVYCSCPENQDCVEIGVNNRRCFFYYGCRSTGVETTTTTGSGIRNASDISQLVVSTTSMMPQNSATEPGEPVQFKFEGGFPPSLNC